jgi:hypothetical protein
MTRLLVTFSEALSDNSAAEGTFTLNNGATVTGAVLSTNKLSLTLSTSALTPGQNYTLTVSGVRDRSSFGNPIAAGSTIAFTAPQNTLPAVLSSVPEAGGYTLINQLAIGDTVNYVSGCNYTVDESRFQQTSPIERIAYCLELTGTNGFAQWVYVSMDAFTSDQAKIGVPSPDRNVLFQQYVSNLTVSASANIAGSVVATGSVAVGNIEFWSSNYDAVNSLSIPGASATAYDVGDRPTAGNYACMQVHNTAALQTIFAMNHFGGSSFIPCLGIGNCPAPINGGNDWTFNENAKSFSAKNLYVLVRWGGDVATGNGPDILIQPQSSSILSGRSASLYVYAPDATAYQWRRNGAWIAGATQSWLAISPAREDDAAEYDVLVYGASGTTASQSAVLTVKPWGTLIRVQ